MDSKRIEELLDKYWKAETSVEEEQQLHAYFCNNDVPEAWKDTAAMFRYFDANKSKSLGDRSFDLDLVKRMQQPARSKVLRLVYNTMRIAAGIAVLVLAVWFIRKDVKETNPVVLEDTYNDPKMAFEETKKALLMISKSFGKAEEQAKKINMFNEAQEEIQRGQQN